jgi:hypothetical protein
VDSVVLIERIIAGESVAAVFAKIGLLACVSPPVRLQGAFLDKRFLTHVTFVGFNSLVDFFVHDLRSLKSLTLNITYCAYLTKEYLKDFGHSSHLNGRSSKWILLW